MPRRIVVTLKESGTALHVLQVQFLQTHHKRSKQYQEKQEEILYVL